MFPFHPRAATRKMKAVALICFVAALFASVSAIDYKLCATNKPGVTVGAVDVTPFPVKKGVETQFKATGNSLAVCLPVPTALYLGCLRYFFSFQPCSHD